ncbi:MAG TPA: YdcF family protein [Pyrinomonadaceae bacterium]|nr:YdcF family protein [Pyrinomonadaceae bacterium]
MKRRILKIALVVIVVWTIVAAFAARSLIVRVPLESADAIVVMSGSSAYMERTQKAAQLYREGRAPRVLLTDDHTRGGWDNAQQRNPFFVERAKDELIKAGVPQDRIEIIPGFAASTRDEAIILKERVTEEWPYELSVTRRQYKSVLVVTSAYHSRRALGVLRQTFEGTDVKLGMEPAPDDSLHASSVFWWLRPEGWRTVGGEYGKLIYYYFKYD